jgi:group II intron reverse transcriptase/maturase
MNPESSTSVLTRQWRIAEIAKQHPQGGLNSIHHHLDLDWLRVAYGQLQKDRAPGHDGETVQAYGKELDRRLTDLLARVKAGSYHAPPVKRVHIPKGNGKETRPIGIPTTEDKVLQRAVTMLLEPIYEGQFYDFSYGFRPGRSAHQALQRIWKQIMDEPIQWIVEVDIRKFFDTLDHGRLREVLRQRVTDGVITKLIDKWLKAGVLEQQQLTYPKEGTPQGGVISPILSNVFLHEVLDKWFEQTVKPRLRGRAFLVRFADDFVMGFERKDDAERVYQVLPRRFEKYGLKINSEKTRIVRFGGMQLKETHRGKAPAATFEFLGFTHYWARSRKGQWYVRRKTASSRQRRALRVMTLWCRKHRHQPIPEQHRQLCRKLHGHYAYYGITGNSRCLVSFRHQVLLIWHKWLNRRSRDPHQMTWKRFIAMLKGPLDLPAARIVHPARAANTVDRGTGCPKGARPDLWGRLWD